MARGRKKHARRSKRTSPRRSRKRNPLFARHGIDRNERIYPSMVKRTPNPRKRKRRKSPRKRSRARRRNPVAYLVNPGGTMARKRRRKHSRKSNPRRKRRLVHARRHNPRRRHRSRRRNPGLLGGLNLKGMIMPAGAAAAGGFVGGFVDAKLASHGKPLRMIAQAALGLVGGALVTKVTKSAITGAAFMGSVVGGSTRMWGESAGGGVHGLEEMAALAGNIAENEQMATLLNANLQGFGLILAPAGGGGGMSGAYGTSGAELDALSEENA